MRILNLKLLERIMTYSERVVFVSHLFKTEHKQKQWVAVVHLLGRDIDAKVARKIGVTANTVGSVRRRMGIAPVNFHRQCSNYGTPEPIRPLIFL